MTKLSNVSVSTILTTAMAIVSQLENETYRLVGVLVIALIWAVHSYVSLMANPPHVTGGGDDTGDRV